MGSVWGDLTLLAVLALVVLFWLSADQARRRAVTAAQQACAAAGVQFLDQTVSLARIGVTRVDGWLCWRRVYRFEYSPDGQSRSRAHVRVLGTEVSADVIAPAPTLAP